MSDLKLIPNAIPPESHGKNLRSMLPKDDWDLLRTKCYMNAEYLCEICGSAGSKHPVEAHEEWHFDIEKRIQTLTGIHALCPDCHLVKHIGRATHLGKFDKAFKHFCKVNKLKAREGEPILRDLLNSQLGLMGVNFRINIDHAKDLLLKLFDEQESILTAFPIIRRKK